MSIEVIFGHFIGSGENRIMVTRQDRCWTGRGKQTEPVVGGAKGHHLIPLKKLEVLGEKRDRVCLFVCLFVCLGCGLVSAPLLIPPECLSTYRKT